MQAVFVRGKLSFCCPHLQSPGEGGQHLYFVSGFLLPSVVLYLICIDIMILYLFLFIAASVQGDGLPFDKEIFPPGSVNFVCWASSLWEWSELDDGLHTLLSPEELHFVFGTKDHSMVSKEEYSVVAIKDTLQQAKEVAKRAGGKRNARYWE